MSGAEKPGAEMGKKSKIDIDAVERDYIAGISTVELGAKYGVCGATISKWMKKRSCLRGRGHGPAFEKAHRGKFSGTPKRDSVEKREADFIERLASDPRTKMYEYVSGYKTRRDNLTVRCRKCGELKVTKPAILFSNKYDHHVCFNCMRIERERAEKERKAAWKEHEAAELAKEKVCEMCGSVYHNASDTSKYCSEKCKHESRDASHRKRARRYGVEYDPSITWQSLSKRLGHCNCEICGEPCDPNDKSWTGRFGPRYPTVDCIIAMKNGGGYVLGNVQLAHAMCNSVKRDLADETDIEKAVAAIDWNGRCYA